MDVPKNSSKGFSVNSSKTFSKTFSKNSSKNPSVDSSTSSCEHAWFDPEERLWGFHCHMELPFEQFPDALIIQQDLIQYFARAGVAVSVEAAFEPGYGPHILHMWEIRIESSPKNLVLEQLGLAASYFIANRHGLSASIHPLMHDSSMPDDFETEGRLNQPNTLWFGCTMPQNQDFFFNPPRDANGEIADTRNPRLISDLRKDEIKAQSGKLEFVRADSVIKNGFHVHACFDGNQPNETQVGLQVLERLIKFLADHQLAPTDVRVYSAGQSPPFKDAGWLVSFENCAPNILIKIGLVIGWLMCNRQQLSIAIIPVIWASPPAILTSPPVNGHADEPPGDSKRKACQECICFLGEAPLLEPDMAAPPR